MLALRAASFLVGASATVGMYYYYLARPLREGYRMQLDRLTVVEDALVSTVQQSAERVLHRRSVSLVDGTIRTVDAEMRST